MVRFDGGGGGGDDDDDGASSTLSLAAARRTGPRAPPYPASAKEANDAWLTTPRTVASSVDCPRNALAEHNGANYFAIRRMMDMRNETAHETTSFYLPAEIEDASGERGKVAAAKERKLIESRVVRGAAGNARAEGANEGGRVRFKPGLPAAARGKRTSAATPATRAKPKPKPKEQKRPPTRMDPISDARSSPAAGKSAKIPRDDAATKASETAAPENASAPISRRVSRVAVASASTEDSPPTAPPSRRVSRVSRAASTETETEDAAPSPRRRRRAVAVGSDGYLRAKLPAGASRETLDWESSRVLQMMWDDALDPDGIPFSIANVEKLSKSGSRSDLVKIKRWCRLVGGVDASADNAAHLAHLIKQKYELALAKAERFVPGVTEQAWIADEKVTKDSEEMLAARKRKAAAAAAAGAGKKGWGVVAAVSGAEAAKTPKLMSALRGMMASMKASK